MQGHTREEQITNLKKNLAWKLCTDLLVPPLGSVTAALAQKTDSGCKNMNYFEIPLAMYYDYFFFTYSNVYLFIFCRGDKTE